MAAEGKPISCLLRPVGCRHSTWVQKLSALSGAFVEVSLFLGFHLVFNGSAQDRYIFLRTVCYFCSKRFSYPYRIRFIGVTDSVSFLCHWTFRLLFFALIGEKCVLCACWYNSLRWNQLPKFRWPTEASGLPTKGLPWGKYHRM